MTLHLRGEIQANELVLPIFQVFPKGKYFRFCLINVSEKNKEDTLMTFYVQYLIHSKYDYVERNYWMNKNIDVNMILSKPKC